MTVCGKFERALLVAIFEADHEDEAVLQYLPLFLRLCPDRQTIPLCPFHHRTGPTSHHALGRRFWMRWNIDRYELIRTYNAKFEKEK